jgi:hypothetical protein
MRFKFRGKIFVQVNICCQEGRVEVKYDNLPFQLIQELIQKSNVTQIMRNDNQLTVLKNELNVDADTVRLIPTNNLNLKKV